MLKRGMTFSFSELTRLSDQALASEIDRLAARELQTTEVELWLGLTVGSSPVNGAAASALHLPPPREGNMKRRVPRVIAMLTLAMTIPLSAARADPIVIHGSVIISSTSSGATGYLQGSNTLVFSDRVGFGSAPLLCLPCGPAGASLDLSTVMDTVSADVIGQQRRYRVACVRAAKHWCGGRAIGPNDPSRRTT